jgi:hypothetical protein
MIISLWILAIRAGILKKIISAMNRSDDFPKIVMDQKEITFLGSIRNPLIFYVQNSNHSKQIKKRQIIMPRVPEISDMEYKANRY